MRRALARHSSLMARRHRRFECFFHNGSIITIRSANDRADEVAITTKSGFENYKIPPIFSKAFQPNSFNFVSYNQKKFDTELSFLIPSDASNLTHCKPRNRFRSTHFASAAPKFSPPTVSRSSVHATSRCISLGSCRPAAGRRTEPNEQDTETVALAIPPASSLLVRPTRNAAQRHHYLAFKHFAPGGHHLSGSGERPRRARAIRASAADIGGT
ncbi:hypothetical protein [Burkholderia ambifaria]|uniref:hypothetical protein n=1 Tax=Burkholderia ambifaria TaxID=152480 RepID=UPI0013DEE66E|nr:hypothetical protein [Burkholderia ambifaria]